jgi:cytochrome c oxidase subunit 2
MRRAWPFLVLLAGCDTVQSMTGGDGRQSALFNQLFAIFLVVAFIMFALVMSGLIGSIFRRHPPRRDIPGETDQARDAPFRPLLIGWAALIGVGLLFLTTASFLTDRAMQAKAPANRLLEIEITANQWWWDVRYNSSEPSQTIRTANELHLPIGVPARITLKSNDVIHSFWVPNLGGKQDLIPGRRTDTVLEPERIGTYRSQCAEYCGAQHAHMALDVTVESWEDFNAWRRRQLTPAPAPSTPLALAGYNYVTTRECASCHAIAGTPASGQIAPDLTHLASRRSIGAGTFPMSRGHLYAWIADPQGAKPGNNMPVVGLEPNELHAVVAYLETLK